MDAETLGIAARLLSGVSTEIYKELRSDFPKVKKWLENEIFEASEQYAENYIQRHGLIKISCIGMRDSVPLDDIFIAVYLLNEANANRYRTVKQIEETFRRTSEYGFQFETGARWRGLDIANREQYLMVLGAPGAGKTTFLRKIGLESLKNKKGYFQHECIPIFIELKTFIETDVDIEQKIIHEFNNCGYPDAENFIPETLKQGKFLVLFDGLDEVPTQNTDRVASEIENFVDKYHKNRFIASCRIAAYKGGFHRFCDVEISALNDEQIKSFIQKWFKYQPDAYRAELDTKLKTANRCWQALNNENHTKTKELARNPLLLTLICLVYDRSQGFPQHRATLYEKAFNILLEEWAAEKRIQRDSVLYEHLSVPSEKRMLAKIACQLFEKNKLFFSRGEIVSQIDVFLEETKNSTKELHGEAVLAAITAEQGLLVERAQAIFSFSHLTFQEYLTAVYAVASQRNRKALVSGYLLDESWWEVFLLGAGVMHEADDLLLQMEVQAQSYIQNMPKIQKLFEWAVAQTDGSAGKFNPAAKRAIAIHDLLDQSQSEFPYIDKLETLGLFYCLHHAQLLSQRLSKDLDLSLSLSLSQSRPFPIALSQSLSQSRATQTSQSLFLYLSKYLKNQETCGLFTNIRFARVREQLKASSMRFREVEKTITAKKTKKKNRRKNVRKQVLDVVKEWRNALCLTEEMLIFSEKEAKALWCYLYAIYLLVECKQASVSVSPDVWSEIEGRMLHPITFP